MTDYKYSLDKSSKKHICPNCEKKRFVLYIDSETKNYLSHEFGRCDREQKCGYHNPPNGNKTIVYDFDYKPKPIDYLPEDYFNEFSALESNTFIDSLSKYIDRDNIINSIDKNIGTVNVAIREKDYYTKWIGACIFWYRDIKNRITYGKVISYDSNCKRNKKIEQKAHSIQKMKNYKGDDFNKAMHLFNIHLLAKCPSKNIALVESEKTACIMNILDKNYLWLANGGLSALSVERMTVIKDRKITLFPDLGIPTEKQNYTPYQKWNEFAEKLKEHNFNIRCSDYLEKIATEENKKNGYDIADFVLQELKEKKQEISNTTPKTEALEKSINKEIETKFNNYARVREGKEHKKPSNFKQNKQELSDHYAHAHEEIKTNNKTVFNLYVKNPEAKIKALEDFFNSQDLNSSIELSKGETVLNPNKLIKSHIRALKHKNEVLLTNPYFNRLNRLKTIIGSS